MENTITVDETIIYTDGSCHPQKRMGAWVAILLHEDEKIILQGNETNTTHNRMELMAVIKAIEYASQHFNCGVAIRVITDSQYAVGLEVRADKLAADNFITKKGKELPNTDLLKILFTLLNAANVQLIKIKAHQQKDKDINYNAVADQLVRSLVRAANNAAV